MSVKISLIIGVLAPNSVAQVYVSPLPCEQLEVAESIMSVVPVVEDVDVVVSVRGKVYEILFEI